MACVDARLRPLERPECGDFEPLPGDGWSHHPYSLDLAALRARPAPENVRMGDLDRLTTLLRQLHAAGRTHRDLPLYITEYGYQTNPPDPTLGHTLAEQARWLSEAERIARPTPRRAQRVAVPRPRPARETRADRAERWSTSRPGCASPTAGAKPLRRRSRARGAPREGADGALLGARPPGAGAATRASACSSPAAHGARSHAGGPSPMAASR